MSDVLTTEEVVEIGTDADRGYPLPADVLALARSHEALRGERDEAEGSVEVLAGHLAAASENLHASARAARSATDALREIRDDFGISIIDGHRVISADAWHIARAALAAAAVVSAEPPEGAET